jgi:hypothetical protein
LISFVFKSIYFLFVTMCSFQFKLQSKCSRRLDNDDDDDDSKCNDHPCSKAGMRDTLTKRNGNIENRLSDNHVLLVYTRVIYL